MITVWRQTCRLNVLFGDGDNEGGELYASSIPGPWGLKNADYKTKTRVYWVACSHGYRPYILYHPFSLLSKTRQKHRSFYYTTLRLLPRVPVHPSAPGLPVVSSIRHAIRSRMPLRRRSWSFQLVLEIVSAATRTHDPVIHHGPHAWLWPNREGGGRRWRTTRPSLVLTATVKW